MVQVHIWQYQGALAAAIAGIRDLFVLANSLSEQSVFQVKTIDIHTYKNEPSPAIVIMPPFIDKQWRASHEDICKAIHEQHNNGAVIAACCASVFWLAETGLLDGCIATTHWSLFEELHQQFPKIKAVDQRHLVIDQGSVLTGAGLFAFQDIVLHLIARFDQYTTAKKVADYALIDFGGRIQNHYHRFYPNYHHGDADVLAAQRLCEKQPEKHWTVASLADQLALSPRTLARRFQQALNITPGQYLKQTRMEKAKQQLESTQHSIDTIGASVGYADLSNFARAFRNTTGLTPAEFRARKT